VSFDRGRQWTRVVSNLPCVPVTDIVVHPRDKDLVIGTRGRGVWILDDAGPLQEIDEVLGQETHLFAIRPGTQVVPAVPSNWRGDDAFSALNPPCGTPITYYLRDLAAGGVTVVVKDARGVTVRKLEGCREPGIHRLIWDLRSPPPRHTSVHAAGADSHVHALLGPFVPEGIYDVALIVSGKICGRQPCRVDVDPLVDLPGPARELQQRALVLLTEMQDRLIASADALRSLTRQLGTTDERLRRPANLPAIVLNATCALMRTVSSLRRTLGWYPPHAQTPPGQHASLGESINRLKSEIAGSASAPTPAQSQALNRLHRDLSRALALVRTVLSDELPALNRQLERHGLSPVRTSIKSSHALVLRANVG
jgi:hypothetical protein